MKKILKHLLKFLARTARPYLRACGLLQTSKVFNKSALVWEPGDERVLVLAPHMDDEVIGCGGSLARHVARGADVTVIFLTDGGQGGITGTRKQEAQRALAELGIQKIEFFDGPDGSLLQSAASVAVKLREALQRVRPAVLYLPFFLEEHPDHRAASQILLEAAAADAALTFQCYGYEVWTPLFPNCFVRIDDTIEAKKRSLLHYQSQLAEADYLHTALGLSAYRSNALLGNTCRYAEAFCALPLPDYLELYRSYGQAR